MNTDTPQLTLYALDTHSSGMMIEVYINERNCGKIKVGAKVTYRIQPGENSIRVVIKSSMGAFMSNPIIVKDVKPDDRLTFYAGPKIDPIKMGVDAGVGHGLSELFGVFSGFFGSKSDYDGHDKVTFGQLAAGEDINHFLDLAQAQKRKTRLQGVWGYAILGGLAVLIAIINLLQPKQSADVSLLIGGMGLLFLGVAYIAYRQLTPAKRPDSVLPTPPHD